MTARERRIATASLAAACWLVALSPLPNELRTAPAIALCLVLPGWALLQVFQAPSSTGPGERILLTIGGSCVVDVLLAIGIGLSPAPLVGGVFGTGLLVLIFGSLFTADRRGCGDLLPVGMEDVSRFPHLVAELLRRGYTEEDVRAIAAGWGAAAGVGLIAGSLVAATPSVGVRVETHESSVIEPPSHARFRSLVARAAREESYPAGAALATAMGWHLRARSNVPGWATRIRREELAAAGWVRVERNRWQRQARAVPARPLTASSLLGWTPRVGAAAAAFAQGARPLAGRARRRARVHVASLIGSLAWPVAAGLVAAAVLVATQVRAADPGLTQLWMTQDAQGAVVGVYNGTPGPVRYRLYVGPQGSRNPATFDLALAPGQRWQVQIGLPPTWPNLNTIATLVQEPDGIQVRKVTLTAGGEP